MNSSSFLHELIAGTVGGVLGITLVYPLDTIKMRRQTYAHYKGAFDVLRNMIRTEGPLSLYRGLLSPQLGFGVTFALSFSGYGQAARYFRGASDRDLTLGEMTLAGSWAGLVQSPARQVFERVKSVMQVQRIGGKAPYRWSGECLVELVRKEGLYHGLFRGFDGTLLREVPQFMVYYPAYELLLRAFREKYYGESTDRSKPLPPYLVLLAGGTAGTIQWLPPFFCADVLKSRLQSGVYDYTSAWDCAVKMYRQEGLRSFFRGWDVALLRAFPLHAIIFFGYEETLAALKHYEQLQPPLVPVPE